MSKQRENWQKSGGSYSGCGAVWTHTSGMRVIHCGHPTALFPYVGELADGSCPRMIAERKMPAGIRVGDLFVPKFKYLKECQQWLEEGAPPEG